MEETMNCGIQALSQMECFGKISIATLIEIAKENGVTLYAYKVADHELPAFPRPAIFHSSEPDHYTFVGFGERSYENLKYTGYALTPVKIEGKKTLTTKQASQVFGGKKGSKIGGTILSIVGAAIGAITFGAGAPIAGALIGAGSSLAGRAVETGGKIGKPLDILSSLGSGAAMATGHPIIAAGAAAAPSAAKGDYMGALMKGGGAALTTMGASGFAKGFNAPAAGGGDL